MPIMSIRKIHPKWFENKWVRKFSTMPKNILGRKFLNHHCLPPYDHFGKFLVGVAHSTKS